MTSKYNLNSRPSNEYCSFPIYFYIMNKRFNVIIDVHEASQMTGEKYNIIKPTKSFWMEGIRLEVIIGPVLIVFCFCLWKGFHIYAPNSILVND